MPSESKRWRFLFTKKQRSSANRDVLHGSERTTSQYPPLDDDSGWPSRVEEPALEWPEKRVSPVEGERVTMDTSTDESLGSPGHSTTHVPKRKETVPTSVRWLGEDISLYASADNDGTLKQLEEPTWRQLFGHRPKNRFVPVRTSPNKGNQRGPKTPSDTSGNSTWVVQTVFAAALVMGGYFATHYSGPVADKLSFAYKMTFETDYSSVALPAIQTFFADHKISLPVLSSTGALKLHVPLSGKIIEDFATNHPEIFIRGNNGESVLAAGSGTVTKVATQGKTSLISIDHGTLGISLYAGVGDVMVHEGEYVVAGQIIGRLPGTMTHPVLRYSLEQKGAFVNPHDFISFPDNSL